MEEEAEAEVEVRNAEVLGSGRSWGRAVRGGRLVAYF